MPHIDPPETPAAEGTPSEPLTRLPFPPITHSHILNCSYHSWQPRYRSFVPKSRVIPLSTQFVSYLRADGIVLPPEAAPPTDDDDNLDTFSDDGEAEEADPSVEWPEIHSQIKSTISEYGGKVTPKLNWSAPKDATWMSATNDLQCRTPNDIYLLLKSSDFITHDLEHPFDDCVPDAAAADAAPADSASSETPPEVPYHLILRKYVNFNPSLEFRCWVRNRVLLCICQRDQNHFDFLFPMRDALRSRIQAFFDDKLKSTFPDPSFVFDVYIPPPHEKVWLIDINPWAERTDSLLFSWLEILTMKDPVGILEEEEDDGAEEQFVRLSLRGANGAVEEEAEEPESESESESENEGGDDDDAPLFAEFRLVKRDDPEAYAFTTPQYSAHKLPKEVVDASLTGPGGMSEFLGQWQDILAKQTQESDSDE
ncbi:cell proliferation protein CDC123 [Aspergillus brunneoviolaceus CBS 621.78]|uniref:D123-domain-containing protein n=1 Tax=Aspergillus brunneoviolaceus CBS 621.78 TaxID=1450534 RepID=A0ACD1FVW8_9EURO|nr:D123-domain-containing protein [Aspergillus brunneoviolaceus CBS 621.78]RAH41150.1 D123-domain-containing protein [Aspergillus brunneoviolaceus CBS 621.78]